MADAELLAALEDIRNNMRAAGNAYLSEAYILTLTIDRLRLLFGTRDIPRTSEPGRS